MKVKVAIMNAILALVLLVPAGITKQVHAEEVTPTQGLKFEQTSYEVLEEMPMNYIQINLINPEDEYPSDVTFDYSVTGFTAASGEDYEFFEGYSGTAEVDALGRVRLYYGAINDTVNEPDETFIVTISNPKNAVIVGPSKVTVTIKGNPDIPTWDTPQAKFRFQYSAIDVLEESPAPIKIKILREGTASELSKTQIIGYNLGPAGMAPTAATPGKDYVNTSGTLTFTAGQKEKTITIQILDDNIKEYRERFAISISGYEASFGTIITEFITIYSGEALKE